MNIAFVIHSLNVGGAETIAVEYLLKLKELGHNVCLIEFTREDSFLRNKLKDNGIRIVTVRHSKSNFFSKAFNKIFGAKIINKRINKFLCAEKFDILHIHTGLDCMSNLKFDIKKVFYSFHTSVERNLKMIGKKHTRNMLNYARKGMNFLVLSESMKFDAQRVLPTDKIYVLPNGLNFDEIKRNVYNRKDFLATLDVPQDAFVLCHIARMHPVKNHIKTIEVFNEIIKKRKNSYLLLIGKENLEVYKIVLSLINKYEIQDNVKILGNRSNATAIMSVCDAMILPSFTEGFSLVALEAQVLGVRSVLTSSVPDEVVCNDNCFKININESNETWASYLLGDFCEVHDCNLDELNIDTIIGRLITYYNCTLFKGETNQNYGNATK